MTAEQPSQFEITGADTGDVDTIADLWVTLADGQRSYGSHLQAESNRGRIQQSLGRYAASDRLLVARTPDTATQHDIIGFVMFRIQTEGYAVDRVRGLIENLYVVSGHRNEGIGSQLLRAAERQLDTHGVDTVTLEVMAANDRARQFYRDHGYEPHRIELEKALDG